MNAAPAKDLKFSTALMPQRDRFDAFRNVMSCMRPNVSLSAPDPQSFWCELTIKPVRELVVFRTYGAAVVTTVAPAAARGEEMLTIQVCTSGRIASEQRHSLTVAGGAGFVSPSTVAGHLSYASHAVVNAVLVRRDALRPLIGDAWPDACANLSAAPGFGLLRGWLAAALEVDGPLPPDATALYEQTAIDLLALTLGIRGDERDLVVDRSVGAALRREVLRRVKQKAANPGLSAVQVARDLGITSRYVHRLLEETGKTFSEHVLEVRLTRAVEMLSARASQANRITDVATAAGFADISYFNRTFRRRFGETPSMTRARLVQRRLV